jgi:DnaJ domain
MPSSYKPLPRSSYQQYQQQQKQGNSMLYIHYSTEAIAWEEYVHFSFSSFPSHINLSGTTDYGTVKILVEQIKQIPGSERTYNPKDKVWTVTLVKFNNLLNLWKAFNYTSDAFIKYHSNLQNILYPATAPNIPWDTDKKEGEPIKPEDFFYSPQQPQSTGTLTSQALETRLSEFLEISDLHDPDIDIKKLYRRAALKFHPDRNNGDATKMTELNYLYQQWLSLQV